MRVVTINDEPWFVAVDVCRCLGLADKKGSFTHHLTKLREDEKTHHRVVGIRGGSCWIISESGVYKLIMRSNKPEAKAFQDWVTKVVLPAIRKDGGYVMGEEKVKALRDQGMTPTAIAKELGIARSSVYLALG